MSRDSRRKAWKARQQRIAAQRAAIVERRHAVAVSRDSSSNPSWIHVIVRAGGTATWIALAAWSYAAGTAGDVVFAGFLLALALAVALFALLASKRFGFFQNRQRVPLTLAFAAAMFIGTGFLYWWEFRHQARPAAPADEIANKVIEMLPQAGLTVLSREDPSLQAWMRQAYVPPPWPQPRRIAPAVVIAGEGAALVDVKVSGGGDAILVTSGHNTFNHVEAIGGHSGINLQGPGYNTFNDVRAISGLVSVTPSSK